MRLGRIGVGIATVTAALALGGAAPAQGQAQDEESCFKNTDTPLDGKCIPVYAGEGDAICVSQTRLCVTGVGDNLEALNEMIPDAGDLIPQRVCTPSLLSGPICVGS